MPRTTASDVLQIKPELFPAPNGWLAVSGPDSPLRIAVIGASEDEALARFTEALEAWARLRAIPDHEAE